MAPAVMMIPAAVAIRNQAPGSLIGNLGMTYTPTKTPARRYMYSFFMV
jgi:hypothetical protein